MAAMTPEIAASASSLLIAQHLTTSKQNSEEVEEATAALKALLGSFTTEDVTLPQSPALHFSFLPLQDVDGSGILAALDAIPDNSTSLGEILSGMAPFKALADDTLNQCIEWTSGNGDMEGAEDAEEARAWMGRERRLRIGNEQRDAIVSQYALRGWPMPPGAMLYALSKSTEALRAEQSAAVTEAATKALAEALGLFNQGLTNLVSALGDVYRSSVAFARLQLRGKLDTQDAAREYANAAASSAEARLQAYRVALEAAQVAAKFPMRAHKAKLQAAETNAQAVTAMLQRKIAVEGMRLKALSDIASSSINGLNTRANVRVRTSLE